MRTKLALKNASMSLLLQLVLAISGILLPRFFIALYGSAVNGLVSSIGQFISYMSLVEAGIGAAGTVALYRCIAQEDTEAISGVVSAARNFYLRSGMIFAALVALLVLVYPAIVQNEIQDVSFIRVMILVLSVNGIVDYFYLGKYRVLLMADQRGYVISLIQIAGTVVMTVVSIVLMNWGFSALAVKGTAALIYLLRSGAVGLYVHRRYPQINFHARPDYSAFSQRWAALLHQIVGMIVTNTDIVLLTLLLPSGALVEVSVYAVYNLVAYALTSLLNSISNGLGSGFGQVIAAGERDTLRRSFSSYEYVFFQMIFIVYSSMAVLLSPFIRLYSAQFTDGVVYLRAPLVALFTVAGLLQALRLPGLTIICAAGHYRQTQWRAVAEALINLGVSVALIRPLGIYGVLLGTCVSYLYRTTDVILYNAKRFLPGSLALSARRLIRNGILAGAMTALGLYLISQSMDSWFAWLGWAVCYGCAVLAVIVSVNVILEPRQGRAMLERMGNMWKQIKRGNTV